MDRQGLVFGGDRSCQPLPRDAFVAENQGASDDQEMNLTS